MNTATKYKCYKRQEVYWLDGRIFLKKDSDTRISGYNYTRFYLTILQSMALEFLCQLSLLFQIWLCHYQWFKKRYDSTWLYNEEKLHDLPFSPSNLYIGHPTWCIRSQIHIYSVCVIDNRINIHCSPNTITVIIHEKGDGRKMWHVLGFGRESLRRETTRKT
jgi:hypothetical protein